MPSQVWGEVPGPMTRGGTQSQVWGWGGTPSQVWIWGGMQSHVWGVPHPRSWGTWSHDQGGTQSQVWGWGYPIPGPGLGVYAVPCLGGYPVQGLGDTPFQVWGVPHPRSSGVPHPRSRGVPWPDLGWGTPPARPGMGYPPT